MDGSEAIIKKEGLPALALVKVREEGEVGGGRAVVVESREPVNRELVVLLIRGEERREMAEVSEFLQSVGS